MLWKHKLTALVSFVFKGLWKFNDAVGDEGYKHQTEAFHTSESGFGPIRHLYLLTFMSIHITEYAEVFLFYILPFRCAKVCILLGFTL